LSAAAAGNFGWFGGAPMFFGGGGASRFRLAEAGIRRLRGLFSTFPAEWVLAIVICENTRSLSGVAYFQS